MMTLTPLRLARRFILLLAFFVALPSWGDEAPWDSARFQAPADAFRRAAEASAPPVSADIEVLYDETRAIIDEGKRWTLQYYMVFRVLTTRGASQWDSLSAQWAPWHQSAPILEARVFGTDGSVRSLATETIKESSPSSDSNKIYSDRRRVEAPLPAIAVGSIVEQRVTLRDLQPSFEAGNVQRFTVGNYAPTRQTRLVIEAPERVPMRFALALLPDAKTTKSATGGTTRVVVDQGPQPALDDPELLLPSDVPRYPAVTVSTAQDWRSVASQYADIVAKQLGPKGSPLVPGLAASGSRNDKIAAVVRWMAREIRYTGIEFGSSALVPHTPQETLARRYGDCKDKALLTVALLRDAGLAAEIALLSAGPGLDVDPNLPGMGDFDHALVHVPGSPELWLDPTDEFSRLGQLPSGDQGRATLLANRATTALSRIPLAPAAENLHLETREVTMAAFGPGTVRETTQSFGALESNYRSFFAYKNDEARKDWAVSYADDEYRTKTADSIQVTDPNDLAVPFQWTTVVSQTPRSTTGLSLATLWVRYEHLFERLPEWLRTSPDKDAKPRKGNVLLPQPFVTELRVKVVPPEGFVATQIPVTSTLELGPARLEQTFSMAADGTVSAVLRFDTKGALYTAAQALDLRDQVLELEGQDPLEFRFEPQTIVLASQGKHREAMERGRQLAAAHPGTEHQLRYAQALAGLGLVEVARAEARKATERAPSSTLAWKVMGEILQADAVGRDLLPGTDWEGARQALTRARALSPDDQTLAGNLAILHEYDDEGTRYSPRAPLATAVSLYESQGVEGRAEAGLEANLAFALFYQGRFAEASRAAAELDNPPLVVLVGSEAMVKGPDAAVALASRRSANANNRAEALRTAGNMLMNLRHYPQATALLRAGATGANATQANSLASMLAKTKPYTDQPSDRSPTAAVRRFVSSIVRDLAVSETTRTLFSPSARAALAQMTDSDATAAMGAAVAGLRRAGIFRDAVTDLMMQLMQFNVEGSDAGYRVRVTVPGSNTMGFLVIKEGSEYKIADMIASPGWSGTDLLAMIDAGQTQAVKTILDWFREEMPPGSADEPATVSPFVRYWSRKASTDPVTLTRAVALVMAGNKEASKAGTDRLALVVNSVAEPQDRAEIEDALLAGYLSQDRCVEAAPLALIAQNRYPTSRAVLGAAVGALTGAGRAAEAQAIADRWLKSRPSDLQALRLKAIGLEASGRHSEAVQAWKNVMATGQSVASDWNSAAWNFLYLPSREQEGLDLALQALQSNQNNGAILHTVACLFAVTGRAAEAKEALIKSMDSEGANTPDDNHRLAQGLLAEGVGLFDVARTLYESVKPPSKASSTEQSSYRLAQNHLKALSARAP